MRIALIVAMARNRVIGRDNQLPWHLPEDLRHFKQLTLGKPLVMGRKTFDSIGRPLPGRTTIVVTRQPDWSRDGVLTAPSLDTALAKAREVAEPGVEEIMVAGGEQVYRAALPLVNRLYVTEVDLDVAGDTRFPALDHDRWRLTGEEAGRSAKSQLAYRFLTYDRV